jgi:class 3 adenylate cyclase
MTKIARAHGATIDKFIGDAILAFFGEPESEGPKNDAERCISMAIEMQRRMYTLRESFTEHGLHDPLEIRIGINSGYCTVGNFGSYERMDYTIIGSPVNIAARLQEVCAPNAILVSGSTQALAGDKFNFAPRGSLALKGIASPVETFDVKFAFGADESAPSTEERIEQLRKQFAQIDLASLSHDERENLMNAISKLAIR